MRLHPHQQRVVDEKHELGEKIARLNNFLTTHTFDNLPDDEKLRLVRQVAVMTEYHDILGERISAFPV